MRVVCHTNLDLWNERWPTELDAVPRVGDEIESATQWGGGFRLSLQVVAVRWEYIKFTNEWIPKIELHMCDWMRGLESRERESAKGSIVAFYEWYAPKVGKSVSSFI